MGILKNTQINWSKTMTEFIDIKLKAANSSGSQTLELMKSKNRYIFTLYGDYRGDNIQIDFDELTENQLDDIITMCTLIKEQDNE